MRVLLAAIGGAAGAAIRWSVGGWLDSDAGSVSWALVVVNLVGCALIGVALAVVDPESWQWPLFVTGGLGGVTTMSAFAISTERLIDADALGAAAWTVALHVLGGMAAVFAGERFARRWQPALGTTAPRARPAR